MGRRRPCPSRSHLRCCPEKSVRLGTCVCPPAIHEMSALNRDREGLRGPFFVLHPFLIHIEDAIGALDFEGDIDCLPFRQSLQDERRGVHSPRTSSTPKRKPRSTVTNRVSGVVRHPFGDVLDGNRDGIGVELAGINFPAWIVCIDDFECHWNNRLSRKSPQSARVVALGGLTNRCGYLPPRTVDGFIAPEVGPSPLYVEVDCLGLWCFGVTDSRTLRVVSFP